MAGTFGGSAPYLFYPLLSVFLEGLIGHLWL
jgi:hypothetical protein